MKKVYGVIGLAAAMALTGCENGGLAATSQESEPFYIIGSVQANNEDVVYVSESTCYPGDPYVNAYTSQLEGTEVLIRDAKNEIVAKSTFHVDHNETSCAWLFDVEIDPQSDFYSADFLEFTTPVVAKEESINGVLEVDFSTPITEQATKDLRARNPIPTPN